MKTKPNHEQYRARPRPRRTERRAYADFLSLCLYPGMRLPAAFRADRSPTPPTAPEPPGLAALP